LFYIKEGAVIVNFCVVMHIIVMYIWMWSDLLDL